MPDWEKELDDFLAPLGVVYTEQTWQEFREEMRAQIDATHVPFYSDALLRDGMASIAIRIASLIACIVIAVMAVRFPPYNILVILLLLYAVVAICLPGLWMWWYCLLPQERRKEEMRMLFEKKTGKLYDYDSSKP